MKGDDFGGYLNAGLYFKRLLAEVPHSPVYKRGRYLYAICYGGAQRWRINVTTLNVSKEIEVKHYVKL